MKPATVGPWPYHPAAMYITDVPVQKGAPESNLFRGTGSRRWQPTASGLTLASEEGRCLRCLSDSVSH